MIKILPTGYEGIESAPENKDVSVMWSTVEIREYGTAIRLGNQWFITSERNEYANHQECAIPTAWFSNDTL